MLLEDMELLRGDPRVAEALRMLREAGVHTGDQYEQLRRIQPTKQGERRSKKKLLDERIKTNAGQLLARRGLKNVGRSIKPAEGDNFKVVKSAIDKAVNAEAGHSARSRDKFTLEQLDNALNGLDSMVEKAAADLFNG